MDTCESAVLVLDLIGFDRSVELVFLASCTWGWRRSKKVRRRAIPQVLNLEPLFVTVPIFHSLRIFDLILSFHPVF